MEKFKDILSNYKTSIIGFTIIGYILMLVTLGKVNQDSTQIIIAIITAIGFLFSKDMDNHSNKLTQEDVNNIPEDKRDCIK